jgi:hypothetical protein
MSMNAKPSPGFVIFAACAAVLGTALSALAYQFPLSSTDIRNAYLLGTRRDSVTADFFAPYRHDLEMPATGPHVADVILETPYAQVVDLGQSDLNPDSQQAGIDLAGKKFPLVVRVGIDLTDTYPGPAPSGPHWPGVPIPDFEKDFKIRMSQNGKEINPESSQVFLLYSGDDASFAQITGAVMELRYDNDLLDPYSDLQITVHTPDDQQVETTFDLGQLK